MNAFFAILIGVVVAGATMTACWMFERQEYLWCLISGVVMGVVAYLTPKTASALWVAPILFCGLIAAHVFVMRWWHKDGSSLKEMVPFLVLAAIMFFITKTAATMTGALVKNAFFASFFGVIPLILLIFEVGYYFADWVRFQAELKGDVHHDS